MKTLKLAAVSIALMTVTAEAELPQFVPSGTYAIEVDIDGNRRWLANPLACGGQDWDLVQIHADYEDAACAWRLNDEGGGYVSVRNTRGGVNAGDYIMKDSKIRLASTVNFVDYRNNQTFRFFGSAPACVVLSNAEMNRYWTPSTDGLTLSYKVSPVEEASVFVLVPLYLHDEIFSVVKSAQEKLADTAMRYDESLRVALENCVAAADALLSSPGYGEVQAGAVLNELTLAFDRFVASGRAPTANNLESLTREERSAMEVIALEGDVTEADFLIIRSDMINLRELHLENSTLTEIPSHALAGMTKLQKVILPQGLLEIGNAAFLSCESLAEVELPQSVVRIGALAFARSGLTEIALGASVSQIGPSAFDGCSALRAITVAADNEKYCAVDGLLFDLVNKEIVKCVPSKSGDVVFPESVKSIANYAFQGCTLLSGDLTIPVGVERIGDFAFANCTSLSGRISLPGGVKAVGRYAFFGDSGVSGVIEIPATVESIGVGAFAYMPRVSTIVLPKTLTSVPASCFECNGAVVEIRSEGMVPPAVGDFALRGIDRYYTYINVSPGCADVWKQADVWCEFSNYDALFGGYSRFSESGRYYIACEPEDSGYLTYDNNGGGARAYFEPDKELATVWSLDFFDVTSESLPYAGGPGSDIRFQSGGSYRHINMEGLCYSDPVVGYVQNDNRTFAFWLVPDCEDEECPRVAIQGNGRIWGLDPYGSGELVATPFSDVFPRPENFCFRLIPENFAEESAIGELIQSPADAEFFTLRGERVCFSKSMHGIYNACGRSDKEN